MTYNQKNATFEGTLFKRGKINKGWKERFFVIHEYEQKIEYYPNQKDYISRQHLCGTIDLSQLQRIEILTNNINISNLSKYIVFKQQDKNNSKQYRSDKDFKEYTFQLVMGNRTYILSTDNDSKLYYLWLNTLSRICYGGVIYEGILKKLGKMNKSWKSRYFILNKYKQMKYYTVKDRLNYLGLIDLNKCILINVSAKSYGINLTNTIEIQTINRTWIICATTKNEKYEWVKWVKAVRWEKLSEQTINNMITMNLYKNHPEDMKNQQQPLTIRAKTGASAVNNNIYHTDNPNPMHYNQQQIQQLQPMDDIMIMQQRNNMNMMILANHLTVMNRELHLQHVNLYSNNSDNVNMNMNNFKVNNMDMNNVNIQTNNKKNNDIPKEKNHESNSAPSSLSKQGLLSQVVSNADIDPFSKYDKIEAEIHKLDDKYDDLYDDEKVINIKDAIGGIDAQNKNENNLKVQNIEDGWDNESVSSNTILLESNNGRCRTTKYNDKRWVNIFSTQITESQVQYHWKIRINNLNSQWFIIIGIMDTCYIDEHIQSQNNLTKNKNKNYFANSKYGYGIDANGNLQNGGTNGGQYCTPFKSGDIVDVYFDMKQFVLWYGLNGIEYGVACKVHKAFYKCSVAMYGRQHCVELMSCDTYFY